MKNFPRRQRSKRKFGDDFVVYENFVKRSRDDKQKRGVMEVFNVQHDKEEVIKRDKCDLEAVVVLHNIFEGVTISSGIATIKKKTENEGKVRQDMSCRRREPVVLLVDCFDGFYHRPIHLKQQSSQSGSCTLQQRGLQDVKLSEISNNESCTAGLVTAITSQVITQLLVNAVTLGNAPNRHNRPFDLEAPEKECAAIAEALCIYTARVDPEECHDLYYTKNEVTTRTDEISDESTYHLPSHLQYHRQQQKKWYPRRQPARKNWRYVTTLGSSDCFLKMKQTSGAQDDFEKKMVCIMKAGLNVDSYNWTLSEVGYILGFWLAKLYKSHGYAEDHLPKEVVRAKEQFLQLYGFQYDNARVLLT